MPHIHVNRVMEAVYKIPGGEFIEDLSDEQENSSSGIVIHQEDLMANWHWPVTGNRRLLLTFNKYYESKSLYSHYKIRISDITLPTKM